MAGVDHVGIGAGFDGINTYVTPLANLSTLTRSIISVFRSFRKLRPHLLRVSNVFLCFPFKLPASKSLLIPRRCATGISGIYRPSNCSFPANLRTPQGLEDVSKYPYLFAELMQDPSWTEEDLKKLAGLNFLRVFQQVEKVNAHYRYAHVIRSGSPFPPAYNKARAPSVRINVCETTVVLPSPMGGSRSANHV